MPADNQFALDRLTNLGNTAEGTNLPPRQTGDIRVPIVTKLKVVNIKSTPSGVVYTLAWMDPDAGGSQIAQYNIYAYGLNGSEEPQGPFTSRRSPATVRLVSTSYSQIRFTVQTQLHNGMTSHMEISPTIAAATNIQTTGASVSVITVTSDYLIISYNYLVLADTSSGNITVTLPASPATGDTYCIKKFVAANTLTIDGNGNTIDGAATLSLTVRYQSYTLTFTGTEWSIV